MLKEGWTNVRDKIKETLEGMGEKKTVRRE